MATKRRFTLNARREIVKTMTLSENLKSGGSPNLFKLSKPVAEASASSLYEESDAEEEYEREKVSHIEPRRGTLKRFKNGGKCLLNFSK